MTTTETSTGNLVFKAVDLGQRVGDRWILNPVSFEIFKGQALAVTGANGSGKTTLINLLLGKSTPSHGLLEQGNGSLNVAAVTGPPPLYSRLSIHEHFELVETSWGGPSAIAFPYLEVLEKLQFSRLLTQYPYELSSGERQAVALCLALIRPAEAVVFDEPEQRLDASRRSALAELLLERKSRGAGVIFASHDSVLIERVADERLILGEVNDSKSNQ